MGKLIEDFLSTTIPPEVWHYTNLAGFEGILSSGRVWATEAHHTTDRTEFVHARDVAARFFERWQPVDDSMAAAKQATQQILIRSFEEGFLAPTRSEIFIASFSAADDLKSQWMEYADAGRGVSLSFDLQHIRPPAEIETTVTFAPCLYKTEDKERMIEDALSDWVGTFYAIHKKTGSQQWAAEQLLGWLMDHQVYDQAAFAKKLSEEFSHSLQQSLVLTSSDLLRIASHCKDYSFHQESEWRLALPHIKGKPTVNIEILHRGTNGAIPYVAHNLFSHRLPVVRVRVGPVCEKMGHIKELLSRYGYDVPVERSTIPIRSAASI